MICHSERSEESMHSAATIRWHGSFMTESAAEHYSQEPPGLCLRDLLRQSANNVFEHLAPVLVALELVEAGAGWSQQDNIAAFGCGVGLADRVFERFRMHDFGPFNLGFDLSRGCSDRVDSLDTLAQQGVQHGGVAS